MSDDDRWNFLLEDTPKIGEAVSNFFQLKLSQRLADATNLHIVSRALLQAINSVSMLNAAEYEEKYPQGDRSATERIEEIGKYKSAQQVLEVVHRRNGKATKLLGRNFLRIIFPSINEQIQNDESIEVDPLELVETFLKSFEKELYNDESVVWAADFIGAVHKEGEIRRQQAQERAAEYAGREGDTGADLLRQAVEELS